MKSDWYSKSVLTVIAGCLGVIALGRSGSPNAAIGQVSPRLEAFDGIDIIPGGSGAFILFDRRTGDACWYQIDAQKDFTFQRVGKVGRVTKVGADVEMVK